MENVAIVLMKKSLAEKDQEIQKLKDRVVELEEIISGRDEMVASNMELYVNEDYNY